MLVNPTTFDNELVRFQYEEISDDDATLPITVLLEGLQLTRYIWGDCATLWIAKPDPGWIGAE